MTRLTEEYGFAAWRGKRPQAVLLARLSAAGELGLLEAEAEPKLGAGSRLISLLPPGSVEGPAPEPV